MISHEIPDQICVCCNVHNEVDVAPVPADKKTYMFMYAFLLCAVYDGHNRGR